MKISYILVSLTVLTISACSTAKERYDNCIENANSFMREAKREIINESSRRKAPHPSDTFARRYGGMMGSLCQKEYEEYKKEERRL